MKKYAFWIEVLIGGLCGFLVFLPNFPKSQFGFAYTYAFLPGAIAVIIYAVLRFPERITIASALKLGALAGLPMGINLVKAIIIGNINIPNNGSWGWISGMMMLGILITLIGNTAAGLILGLLIKIFYRLPGLMANLYNRFQSKNIV